MGKTSVHKKKAEQKAKKKTAAKSGGTLIQNRKARFDFEMLEQFEAGMELSGFEVKALKNGMGNLEGSHVIVRGGEAFLIGVTIQPYQPGNAPKSFEQTRTRKLLLTKDEIAKLSSWEAMKGHTVIPLSVFLKGKKVKLSLAAARGKKKYDKRETIKARRDKRDIERQLKQQHR